MLCRSLAARAQLRVLMSISAPDTGLKQPELACADCVSRMVLIGFHYRALDLNVGGNIMGILTPWCPTGRAGELPRATRKYFRPISFCDGSPP